MYSLFLDIFCVDSKNQLLVKVKTEKSTLEVQLKSTLNKNMLLKTGCPVHNHRNN